MFRPTARPGAAPTLPAPSRAAATQTGHGEPAESSNARAASIEELRAAFERTTAYTVGVEEELMLLDPVTLDLAPRGANAMEAVADPHTFRRELPAAQLEIVTRPCDRVSEAAAELGAARAHLLRETRGSLLHATAGTHPFAAREGVMSEHERYQRIAAEYGTAARQALVNGLHVHVAVPGADRALAVHDALREYLPLIAVLAGNAPFLDGADTGYASVRPKLAEALPRQGVPPVLGSWEALHELLAWGHAARAFTPAELWWEVRLHPKWGTVEVRVADAQLRVSEVTAVAAVIQCLVRALAQRYDAGELHPPVPTERVAENRWRALRFGLGGTLLDPRTGEAQSSRELAHALIASLEPQAAELDCRSELAAAATLAEFNGAEQQRAVAADVGLRGLVAWMVEQFGA